MTNSLSRSGVLLAMCFVALSATRDVWGYDILKRVPLPFVVLVSFFSTAVVANIWAAFSSGIRTAYKRDSLWDLVALNVTTALAWAATFIGMSLVLPATLATLVVGFLPIVTLFLDRALRGRAVTPAEYVSSLVLFMGIVLVALSELGDSALAAIIAGTEDQKWEVASVAGVSWCLMASAFAAANNVIAKRLNDAGIGATAAFGARFWVLLTLAACWLLFRSGIPRRVATPETVEALALGLLGIAAPVFCLMHAIQRIGPRSVGFMISAVPIVVVLLQALVAGGETISIVGVIGTGLVCSSILYSTIVKA